MATFFFCGIGGIGMSAIALYLKKTGHIVKGSDRSFDMGLNQKMKESLLKVGIELYPQNGTGVDETVEHFITSTAVEESIPDVKKALEHKIPIFKRAQALANVFHTFEKGIAIGGTSGKTTVTAMTGHILHSLEKHPVMINGGISLNHYNGEDLSNLIYDKGTICVIEADESDGSIEFYNPFISVVTNISLDHKPLEEIRPLFERFLKRATKGCVINKDCPETKNISLPENEVISFSIGKDKTATLYAENIVQTRNNVSFLLNSKPYELPFIGVHNVANALAAIGVALLMGISIDDSINALQSFKGTKRRLEFVGEKNNIAVIDDYAHNEEKIKASLSALKQVGDRLFVVYQPHGFAPLKLMKDGLIEMLKKELDETTFWSMLPVYYVGGTVNKTISSTDIVEPLKQEGKNALYFENREVLLEYLKSNLKAKDTLVVMGARDDTLSLYAQKILDVLGENKCN